MKTPSAEEMRLAVEGIAATQRQIIARERDPKKRAAKLAELDGKIAAVRAPYGRTGTPMKINSNPKGLF